MRYRLFIYVFSLFASIVGTTLLIVYGEYYLAIPAFLIVILSSYSLVKEYRSNTRKITYMLNALENNDTSFRFFDKGGDRYNRLYANTLNRINEILASEKMNAREQEKYFELLLDNVITGIVTVNEKGAVVHCNNKALDLMGLSVLTHISQIQKVDDSLYKAFLFDEKEVKPVTIYNESGEVHLSLRFSYVKLRGEDLKIIAINDIGEELEEKESESWIKLIRVLNHEIMNTITPISSLSETLSAMVNKAPELDPTHEATIRQEIKQGLEVISVTSKGLISFVDSYRNLTRIPTPTKKPIFVRDLIHRVLTLIKDNLEHADIHPSVELCSDDVMIYADENLISQVLINLIKNAVAAIGERKEAEGEGVPHYKPFVRIRTTIEPNSEDVILEVSNNGKVIPKEEQEHIFVPFFTTKATGTGIGLSISRQIMRKHEGSLKLKCSNENETAFVLIFR